MPLPDAPRLIYRGHFRVSVGADYSGSILSADMGGGFEESETIFPRLHTCSLNYSNLHRDAMIEVSEGVFKNRLEYLWDFYCASKDNGNEPFLMKFPLNGRWYLWKFLDDNLDVELLNLYAGTSGLKLRQRNVPGVAADLPDGGFEEEGS